MTFPTRILALASLFLLLSFRSGDATVEAAVPAAPTAPAPAGSQCSAMGVSWDGFVFWAGCPTFSCSPTDCQAEHCTNCGAYYCNCPNNAAQCQAYVYMRADGTVARVLCIAHDCGPGCSTQFPPGPGQKFYFCKC